MMTNNITHVTSLLQNNYFSNQMHVSLEVYGATACQINMKNYNFQLHTFGLLWNWNLHMRHTYMKCQILALQFLSQSNSIPASNHINVTSCCHLMLSHMVYSSVIPIITSSSVVPFIPKNKCHYYNKVASVQHPYTPCTSWSETETSDGGLPPSPSPSSNCK
jgi:hypothetical protein